MNRPRRRPRPRAYPAPPGGDEAPDCPRCRRLEEWLAVSEGERRAMAEEVRRLNAKLADGELP